MLHLSSTRQHVAHASQEQTPRGKSAEAGFLHKSANGAVTSVYWIIPESDSPHVQRRAQLQSDMISSFSATYSKGAVHFRMNAHSTWDGGEVMTPVAAALRRSGTDCC